MLQVVRRARVLGGLAAVLCLIFPAASRGGSYAAMESVPVTGGELRLTSAWPGPSRPDATGFGSRHPVAGTGDPLAIGFPLKHTDVDIRVDGLMAEAVVQQHFENPFEDPIEAVYVFPLPDGAAVTGYEILIGDRTVRGVIKERGEARKTYEKARDDGHATGLLEQEKDDVFAQSIANIPARQDVRVRISYVVLIERTDEGSEIVFPMVVGPRYLPEQTADPRPLGAVRAGDPAIPGARTISYLAPHQRSGHDISLRVSLDAGVPVQDLRSPSHRIVQRVVDATAIEVELAADDMLPNKDFVLRYSSAGDTTFVGFLAHRQDREGYFTLIVQPKAEYATGDIAPREVVLAIDRSGSMAGEPLGLAITLARRVLGTLTERDRFNIIAWSTQIEAYAERPVQGNPADVQEALRYLDGLSSGGGTEMKKALRHALAGQPAGDHVRTLYFFTDGYIGNDEEVLRVVRKTAAFNRLSTIGIGAAPNRSLLNRMAEVGRGVAVQVTPGEDPHEAAELLVRRTTHPHLLDLEIDWAGLGVRDVTPAVLPDLQAGVPLVVSGRYDRPGSAELRLSATLAGRRLVTPLRVELPERADRPGVCYTWARRRIHRLQVDALGKGRDANRKAIQELGLAFGLVTPYTSFVAVDEEQVVDGSGRLRTVHQPVPLPAGVDFDGVFGEDGRSAPVPSQVARRSYSHQGGGGSLFDDVDPLTLVGLLLVLPVALWLRARRGL